jgi:hypothetical protein
LSENFSDRNDSFNRLLARNSEEKMAAMLFCAGVGPKTVLLRFNAGCQIVDKITKMLIFFPKK